MTTRTLAVIERINPAGTHIGCLSGVIRDGISTTCNRGTGLMLLGTRTVWRGNRRVSVSDHQPICPDHARELVTRKAALWGEGLPG
jgi:hypothetical protein